MSQIIYESENSTVNVTKEGHIYNIGVDTPEGVRDFIQIHFQDGAVQDAGGRNGLQNEEVLAILVDRLQYLNKKFPCRENSIVITKLEEALMWLERRTALRKAQGIEGKNEAHTS